MGKEKFRWDLNNVFDEIAGAPSSTFRERVQSSVVGTPKPKDYYWIAGVAAFLIAALVVGVIFIGNPLNRRTAPAGSNSTPTRTQPPKLLTVAPPARYGSAWASNLLTGQLVLFGGMSGVWGAGPLDDTWIWDGSEWHRYVGDIHPPARSWPSMGYDPISKELILYGGSPSGTLGSGPEAFGSSETWTWNGVSWRVLNPPKNPGPRWGVSMAADPSRNQLLLFGGGGRPNEVFFDTWAWDGADWAKLKAGDAPHMSSGGSLAYDPISKRMMLMGPQPDRQVFLLEQNGWVARTYDNDAVRYWGSILVTDHAHGHVLLMGGTVSSDGATAKTVNRWEWTGSDWVAAGSTVQGPIGRWNAVGAFDKNGTFVLFGGQAQDHYGNLYALDDTWIGRRTEWVQRSPLTTAPMVRALFFIAAITSKDPPANMTFRLEITKPDGTQITADLCAWTSTSSCKGSRGYAWSFAPMTNGGNASYRVLYGLGNPTAELASGSIDLLRSKTYYVEYKGQ